MFTNIGLFVLGLAIGLLVCSIYTRWQDKEFMDLMASNHDFLEKYAMLTDKQYNDLNKYVKDQMTLLYESVNRLFEISRQMSRENNENWQKMTGIVANGCEVQTILLNDFTDFVKEHEKVNEERWSLIVDYITNDSPERAEDTKKHYIKDICDRCKNQQTEKCADCHEPISSTEVRFVNYEAKEEDKDDV